MIVNKIIVGDYNTNCYILTKNNKSLIIDPGDEVDKIVSNIKFEVVGILITHNHFDHIGGVDFLIDKYKVKKYDYNNLKIGLNNLSEFKFNVIYNPGHTLDSISFLFENNMFCGDFIFKNSIGRCDLGGDALLMKQSIKSILNVDKNYLIYPGHGDKTSLKEEYDNLVYFKSSL